MARTEQEIENAEAWLDVRRGAADALRQRAPGMVVGAVTGAFVSLFLASMAITSIPLFVPGMMAAGTVFGAIAGAKLLGDLSRFTQRDPDYEPPVPQSESPQQGMTPEIQLARQQARIASAERLAADHPPQERPENYFAQTEQQRRGAPATASAVTAPPPFHSNLP